MRVIRTVLSGTHEDMMNIAANGQLDDWCNDSLKWLQDTFGKENVVSVVLHMDEHTPHLHASIVPIVTGEQQDNGRGQADIPQESQCREVVCR